jgi:hypothetical protein
MKLPSFVADSIVIAAFGRELERLRNHPELAWQRTWRDAADASMFYRHDAIKEIAFAVYGIADELRLKSPWGRRQPIQNSERIGVTTTLQRSINGGRS